MRGQDGIDGAEPPSGKSVQVITSILLNFLAFGTGASYGIPNVIFQNLDPKRCNVSSAMAENETTPYCPFVISSEEKSWVANSATIGLYFTLFFACTTVSHFGKRISLMIDCCLSLLGFGLIAFARNVPMLCIAKFLLGYADLTSRSSIQPFISEICDPALRSVTTSFYVISYITGQALSILTANQFVEGWRYVSGAVGALMIICFLVLLLWVHETPDWLLEKSQFKEATKSLHFYKIDRKELIDDEEKRKTIAGEEKTYEEIVAMYQEESTQARKRDVAKATAKKLGAKIKEKTSSVMMRFKQPAVYKPFILLTTILGLLELSGFSVMANFSISLMEGYGYEEHKTFLNAADVVVLLNLSRIPISFLAIPFLKKMRKRPLYLITSVSLLIILIGIILFTKFIAKEDFQKSIGLQIIPLILFILFFTTFSFGSGNIPFGLMGELFPPNSMSLGNTGVFILSNICGFIAIQTALAIKDTFGLAYVFVMPVGAVAASIFVASIFMPETQGLPLEDIRKIYGTLNVEIEKKTPYYHRLRKKRAPVTRNAIANAMKQSVYVVSPEASQGFFESEDLQ